MAVTTGSVRIDTTARDFDTFKSALIQYLRDNFPDDFTDFTESQLGVALLEITSYGFANLAYYQNRIANEVYLSTARERRNVVLIARQLGYTPALSTAASVDLEIDTATAGLTQNLTFTISSGAQVTSGGGAVFEADQDYTLDFTYVDGTNDTWSINGGDPTTTPKISVQQGQTFTQQVTGDGQPFQRYILDEFPVISGSIQVRVDGVLWTEAESLVLPTDPDDSRIYEVLIDEKDRGALRFGDGITGAIVVEGSAVDFTYRVGGGSSGNITANSIATTITATETQVGQGQTTLPVFNPGPASGGQDRESLESIKFFAPAFLKTNDRAITGPDYVSLSAGFTDGSNGTIAKADVIADPTDGISNVVTCYVWTANVFNVLVDTPSQALKDSLKSFLDSRRVVTVQVSVVNGTNVPVDVVARIRVDNASIEDDVVAQATTVVEELFKQERVRFGNELRYSWIVDELMSVPGVAFVHVTSPDCNVVSSPLNGGVRDLNVDDSDVRVPLLGTQAGAGTDEVKLPTTLFNDDVDGYYCNYRIQVNDTVGGSGVQERRIINYTASGATAQVELDWDRQPAQNDEFRLWHPRLVKLDTDTSTVDDFYNNRVITLTEGDGAGQTRFIIDYQRGSSPSDDHNDGPKVCRIDSNWNLSAPPNEANGSPFGQNRTEYLILPDLKVRSSHALVNGSGTSITALSSLDES